MTAINKTTGQPASGIFSSRTLNGETVQATLTPGMSGTSTFAINGEIIYLMHPGAGLMTAINKTTGQPASGIFSSRTLGGETVQATLTPGMSGTSTFVVDLIEITKPHTNIEMQISLEKNYINKKIEETFYSSATVRNF